MGNQPGVGGTKQRQLYQQQQMGNSGLRRSGKVSPYTPNQIQNANGMNMSRSPSMMQGPSPMQGVLRGRVTNQSAVIQPNISPDMDPRLERSSRRQSPTYRKLSPSLTRDLGESRIYSDTLNQALSRALGDQAYNQESSRRDNLSTSTRAAPRDYSPRASRQPRDYSMQMSKDFRDYTPPRTMTNTRSDNRFSEKELAKLRLDFNLISENQNVLREKLIEYLGIEEIGHSQLIERLLSVLQQSLGGQGRGTDRMILGFDKFTTLVGILCKGDANERLELIYKLFDAKGQGYVMKDEFCEVYTQFFQAMMVVNFHQNELSQLRMQVDTNIFWDWI